MTPTRSAYLVLCFASLACGVSQKNFVGDDAGGKCSVLPNIACSAVAQGPTSCTGGPDVDKNGVPLPTDASFPPGCQAYFRGSDCSSHGYCTCDPADDAGAPAYWNCHDTDGGT